MSAVIEGQVLPLDLGQHGAGFFDLLGEVLTCPGRDSVRRVYGVTVQAGLLAVQSERGARANVVHFATVDGRAALVVTAPHFCSWGEPTRYRLAHMLKVWGVCPADISALIEYAKTCVREYRAA